MRQKWFIALVVVLVCPGAFALTSVWGAGYENHEKMGIPKDVDPIHETYIPVVKEQDPQTLMQQEIEQKDRDLSCERESSEQFVWLNRRYGERETQLSRSAIMPLIRADSSQNEVI